MPSEVEPPRWLRAEAPPGPQAPHPREPPVLGLLGLLLLQVEKQTLTVSHFLFPYKTQSPLGRDAYASVDPGPPHAEASPASPAPSATVHYTSDF